MGGTWCNICAGNNVDIAKDKFYSIILLHGGQALTPYINSITKLILCVNMAINFHLVLLILIWVRGVQHVLVILQNMPRTILNKL